ncbi:hypothetical protein KDL45_13075, partial [bacterium]|nr:hypothetical protein [bacterium]
MGGVRGFRLAALVLAGVFLPAMAAADSFESLMGDPYGTDGAPAFTYATPDEVISQDPIFGRVDRLVYPVQGMPALVEPGGEIELRVLSSQPESLRKLWEWRVNLATASEMEGYTEPVGAQAAQRYTLITTNIRYDYNFGGYRVIVQVPEDVPYDTYHLEVDTFRFSDVQPNAVGVRPADGDTFRMVVMSDAQYGDPDVDADAAWVGRRSFEFDDDTVQAEMLERQWADDLPFLSPDLVLSTGNLIYGLGPN